jgi:hypothetical protein
MFDKGFPIVSTSGGAGYHIDIDLSKWDEVISELEGRKKTISTKLDAAYRIVGYIRKSGRNAIPSSVPASVVSKTASKPEQLSFMDGGR